MSKRKIHVEKKRLISQKMSAVKNLIQGLLQNGQDTDRQNFYFLYLTENEYLSLISFEDL